MTAPAHAPRTSRAPTAARRWRAQTGMELRLAWRNGENLLVTLVIPLGLLLFFGLVDVLPRPAGDPLAFLVPGIMALSVIGAAMVSLGIATAFERSYLVLKRLGATPLRRGELIAAKGAAVLATEAVQWAAVAAVGAALGWRPDAAGLPLTVAALVLGTAAFAGIGLGMAGSLRAVGTLAGSNGLFVVLLLISGIVLPLSALPGPLATVARVLPAAPLAAWLRAGLAGQQLPVWAAVGLPLWAVAAPVLAARTFRWD